MRENEVCSLVENERNERNVRREEGFPALDQVLAGKWWEKYYGMTRYGGRTRVGYGVGMWWFLVVTTRNFYLVHLANSINVKFVLLTSRAV